MPIMPDLGRLRKEDSDLKVREISHKSSHEKL
jgi:hypothetical protein